MAGKKSTPKERTFNPLAAHGTVHPPERGAVFYQDGGYFNSAGKLVFEDHPATTKKVVVEETVVDVKDGKSTSKTVKTETDVVVEEPGDPKEILAKWLRGDLVLNHGAVRKFVKAGFAVSLAKQDDIISYLVNTASLVPAELVNIKPAPVGK